MLERYTKPEKRYTKPEMGEIWEDATTYHTWFKVELVVCQAWEELGKIPEGVSKQIERAAYFTIDRIEEIEKEVKHNVIAFLTCLAESLGDNSRYVHLGLTSSDVLDTALSIQAVKAADLLIVRMMELEGVLRNKAYEYKDTIMMGRSHGIHAEPITWGLKLANFYSEMQRNRGRLIEARENMRFGKISGAVGTYAHIPPRLEEMVCKKLRLKQPDISNQILQRDRHAEFITVIAIVGCTLDKIATEIRHLMRTEVNEVSEPFTEKQKGSSAMPHKKNPIRSENICGCARLLRGYAVSAMENVALWHERDISHSSVERIIFPDATILLYHMLTKTINIIKNMVVFEENMEYNLGLTNGVYTAQKIMLLLVKNGMLREDAYKIVQKCALQAISEYHGDMRVLLKKELSEEMYEIISKEFEAEHYVKNRYYTFKKVFGEDWRDEEESI